MEQLFGLSAFYSRVPAKICHPPKKKSWSPEIRQSASTYTFTAICVISGLQVVSHWALELRPLLWEKGVNLKGIKIHQDLPTALYKNIGDLAF